jgi:hypothetical protein
MGLRSQGYCATAPNLVGIDRAVWSGWGKSKATAHGLYIDGLGFGYPAPVSGGRYRRTSFCRLATICATNLGWTPP